MFQIFFVFALILTSVFSNEIYAQGYIKNDLKKATENFSILESALKEAGNSPTACNTKNEVKADVKLSIADCSSDVTETDRKIIEKILDDLKVLSKRNLDKKSSEYKNTYAKIIQGADEALSSAAKGILANEVFKETFTVPNETKEFKRAFIEFQTWAGFHVKSFGPGTEYASLGIMDSVRTPIHWVIDQVANDGERTPLGIELYKESMLRFHEKWTKLNDVISKLDLPREEKSELFAKVREYGQMIEKRDGVMLDATQDRIQAFQSAVVQIGAAVEAKLITRHLSQSKKKRPKAVAALIDGINTGAGIIFKEHTKIAIKAFQSGGDIGCA